MRIGSRFSCAKSASDRDHCGESRGNANWTRPKVGLHRFRVDIGNGGNNGGCLRVSERCHQLFSGGNDGNDLLPPLYRPVRSWPPSITYPSPPAVPIAEVLADQALALRIQSVKIVSTRTGSPPSPACLTLQHVAVHRLWRSRVSARDVGCCMRPECAAIRPSPLE